MVRGKALWRGKFKHKETMDVSRIDVSTATVHAERDVTLAGFCGVNHFFLLHELLRYMWMDVLVSAAT